MNNKKGISLIVLVITILVMIILAGVVIVSLQNDNPIDKAKTAKLVDSVSSVRGAISQYAVTAQANENYTTKMNEILGAALTEGTYKGWKFLDTTSKSEKIKTALGIDVSAIKEGKFYVNPDSGASVFVIEDANYGTPKVGALAKAVDGKEGFFVTKIALK